MTSQKKWRTSAQLAWLDQSPEIAIDEVDDLGSFVELEIIADEKQLEQCRECLSSLAKELGLSRPERRSYLELLLER